MSTVTCCWTYHYVFKFQVLTLEDGSLHDVWRDAGLPVSTIETNERMKISIDWLK